MLRQELNTYKKQQELEKSRREFNSRVNQILNNQNHHQILPTTNEVKIIEKTTLGKWYNYLISIVKIIEIVSNLK